MKQNRKSLAAKKGAAEVLFAALGEIDDRYLTEAMEMRNRARKPKRLWRTVLPLAASLGLVCVLLTVGTVSLFKRILFPGRQNAPSDVSAPTLSEVLRTCTESDAFTPCDSVAELPFSDGHIRVIVGTRDGGIWVSRPLVASESRVLAYEYVAARGGTGFDAPDEAYLVWISSGDGEVWTPCLSGGSGNVSFDRLFSYESEREPSASFTNLLAGIAG